MVNYLGGVDGLSTVDYGSMFGDGVVMKMADTSAVAMEMAGKAERSAAAGNDWQ